MASAVAGFIQTFGIDEPAGCYDDIELTDSFVLWGSNMAENHPVMNADMADVTIVFKPHTEDALEP